MNKFILNTLVFAVLLVPSGSWAQEYGLDVPYEEAVPNFWFAVGDAVEPYPEKDEIAEWADEVSLRIDEFLADMIFSIEAMEGKPLGSPDISEIEAFNAKWRAIVDTCPDCDQIVPLVEPIVEELLDGLPILRKTQPQDVPLQNFFELFQELEALNPWGTASLFQLEPVTGRKDLTVAEQARETKTAGVEEIFVNNRIVTENDDGQPVFQEQIVDDQVLQVSFSLDAVTMLHETLDGLIRDGGDPEVIAMLEDLTDLVDEELTKAWDAGLLDDFTYFYFFDQSQIQNELVHVKHPLLKDPFIQEYKTAEFYPRTFDDNQALSLSAVNRSQRIQSTLDDYSKAAENASVFWVLGVLSPISVISLFGFGKFIF